MRGRHKRSILAAGVGIVVLAVLLGLLLSQRTNLFSQSEQPKLELVIVSQDLHGAKAKFLLGQPIRLQMVLRNVSKEPQTGASYLSFYTDTLYAFIAPGDGPFELYMPQSLAIAQVAEIALKPITLQPEEKREGFEFISYDVGKKDFALAAQGKYRIKAELRFASDRSQKLESNVIEVEVVQPENQEDKEALQFIIDKQLKAYLTAEARSIVPPEGKTVNDQVQLLQEFLKKFEKSTYAPYVKLALAAICWGREQELPACRRAQSQPSQLSFTIKAEKDKLLVGEPLKIQMQVRNETKDDLQLQFSLSFRCANDVRVAISSDGGKTFQPYTSRAMWFAEESFCIPEPFTLKGGEERKGEEFIGFHVASFDPTTGEPEGDFAFPKAGKYQIKMTLAPEPLLEILESNVVEVEVVEPEGQDKEALQFIVGNQLKPFLTPEAAFFPVTDETVQKLQQFLEKFPHSTYAPYVQLGLNAICRSLREQLPACQK